VKITIRQLREERGESETQLAEALGTTLQDVHDLETALQAHRWSGSRMARPVPRQTPIVPP
jgi:transcriptional regulator with XRE-family HTH domain